MRDKNRERISNFEEMCRLTYGGKRILVTGAGGSIGSQLVMQLIRLAPLQIAALDNNENALYELEQELRLRDSPILFQPFLADVRDAGRLASLCKIFSPQVIFHAAAYKQVPLMELHPCEAILSNVVGAENILNIVTGFGAERFVFISTVEALNPASVMGATKRVGEMLALSAAQSGRIRTASIRLRNVLGSRGGVVPLFQRQIAQGGPVTVTHPDAVRHFMTMQQAVHLTLAAGCEAQRGEIYVTEMGLPRNILELAREMILLSGSDPEKDIAIQMIGMRPGERLVEELTSRSERQSKTRFDGLFVIKPLRINERDLRNRITQLVQGARNSDRDAIYRVLATMGIGFNPTPQYPTHELASLPSDLDAQNDQPKESRNSAESANAAAAGSSRGGK